MGATRHRYSMLSKRSCSTKLTRTLSRDLLTRCSRMKKCPWRLDDGEFFAVDQTFMGMRLAELAGAESEDEGISRGLRGVQRSASRPVGRRY